MGAVAHLHVADVLAGGVLGELVGGAAERLLVCSTLSVTSKALR
jgi:hypothetical protein